MKIQPSNRLASYIPAPKVAESATVAEAPVKDSVLPLSTIVGGSGGLVGAGLGLYAGSLGGAVVGSALGGGVGIVLGALAHSSPAGWLSTSFSTAGDIGRVGILLGGGAGLLGGWKLGRKLTSRAPEAPQVSPTGLAKGAAAAFAGTGMVAATVGGLLGAGALVGAGKIATGLLAGQVSWSSVGATAAVAGAVGAAAMGTLGAVGGWQLFRKAEWSAQQTPKIVEWAKNAPQNGLVGGALAGAATLVTTGLLGQISFPMVGPAAAGVVGQGVGFGVGRLLTTPRHRDPLTFAHCMAIGGVVSMFSATSFLPLPANLLARAALGAAGGAFLGHKIRKMREGLS